MKIRILDRILVAVAALILLASCAAVVAQAFFHADVTGFAARVLAGDSFGRRAALTLIALGLLLLGVYCMMIVFRHRGRKDRYVRQQNENGELAISMTVLDQMIRKCLEEHPELDAQGLELENRRDGLLIRLKTNAAGGISIPLTVEALQKQIRQYVTACSGVEISAVQVEIETSGGEIADAAFAIPAPASARLLRDGENKAGTEAPKTEPEIKAPVGTAPATEAETAETVKAKEEPPAGTGEDPAPVQTEPAAEAEQEKKLGEALDKAILEEEDDRPMHQRLFSAQPEPCIVPAPPADSPAEAEGPEETEKPEEPEAGIDAVPAEPEEQADTEAVPEGLRDAGAETGENTSEETGEETGEDAAQMTWEAAEPETDPEETDRTEEERPEEERKLPEQMEEKTNEEL